ncbi:MAG: YaeQ family protein, partial [Candidatus Thiodiazotropha sp. (ex Lucinoma annulata)]|nr:YaeQ family protein [Candidatus Thiodiazotropha sp. (ex Lucinoma annulata)]
SLCDEIELWIELGQLDEKRLRRACGKAKQVIVYLYADRSATVWWEQNKDMLKRFSNLRIVRLSVTSETQLNVLSQRNMHLNATIQENQVWLSDDKQAVTVEVSDWLH